MSLGNQKASPDPLGAAFNKHIVQGHKDNLILGNKSKLVRGLNNVLYGPASAIAAGPGRIASNTLGGLLFGAKERYPLSPVFGKRLREVKGMKGLQHIDKAEYDAIKAGLQPGKAYKGKISGHLLPQFYKRKYVHGGLVGLAQRHPLMAGGGALLAYFLAKSPENRNMAAAMIPKMNTDISPETVRQWKEPEVVGPFQRRAWG